MEQVYSQNDSVLRNLFSFTDAMLDIKGYTGPQDFARNFPFVPYQFIIMQKVFAEIRKHGNSGKHLSGGERSMLSGFQEAAQKMVDTTSIGAVTGGMRLRIMTVATDTVEKSEFRLMTESKNQAIVVLAETPYYESLEKAMKVRKYVKQRNVAQLPKSVQDIIRNHQDEANKYEASAEEDLKKAIVDAEFYVDGERIEVKGGDAKSKLDQALEYLVTHVYSELGLITKNADTDADILAVLQGDHLNGVMAGMEENHDAAVKMEEYLEMQDAKKLPTSMADVQSRYQAIPYGWKEIDIAVVAAMLIYDQKVTIKYGGETIQPGNPKLPDMLRKKSEIGRSQEDIDAYVERMRAYLTAMMKDCDGIKLS